MYLAKQRNDMKICETKNRIKDSVVQYRMLIISNVKNDYQ